MKRRYLRRTPPNRKRLPSFATIVRRCKRYGIHLEWLATLDQDRVESLMKTSVPVRTHFDKPTPVKGTTTAKSQSTSTLASQLPPIDEKLHDLKISDQYDSDSSSSSSSDDDDDDIQEKLSSDIATTSTSMPQSP